MTALGLSQEQANSRIRSKYRVEVDIVLTDGTKLNGFVFVSSGERVQDLLNEDRLFVPLQFANQEILLINKTSIALCKPLDIPG